MFISIYYANEQERGTGVISSSGDATNTQRREREERPVGREYASVEQRCETVRGEANSRSDSHESRMDPILTPGKKLFLLYLLFFILIYQAHITWGTESLNLTHQHDFENSESSRIMLEKWDPAFQTEQRTLESNTSSAEQAEAQKPSTRRASGECASPCLNGGRCVHPDSCNCTLYQAAGTRCQTVPNLGFEREMTCRSWGQYNYETFDGLYYYFPGKCSYTLLRDCEDNARSSVHIQVHNDPECSSSPYSCTRSISLFLPWEGEIRLQHFSVTFKGQSVLLPHHIHDVELERISDYIVVSQPHVFTLAWQGLTSSVYIKMSPEFVGHTCGLCGNFNADTQDDLKTSYGVFTQDLAMFGNSWAEEEPELARCTVVPSLYPSPCATLDPHVLLKVEEVCSTLLREPFQSCHEFVSPYSYMASCSNDLCLSGPNGAVVCQVFTEYARACAHADHPLHDWRTHFPVCNVDCPDELLFRECITCCPMHCKIEQMCIDSKLQCLDGCYCPDDLIFEDGVCVKASDCPCEHHGMLYPSGHIIQEDCNNCTCFGGIWNCTEHNCPGECSVTGDMFFQSFDGRVYTFPATCQYVLAKSRNSGKFTVTIQNAPCGANLDGACIQSVNLVVNEDPRTEITMSHSGEVFLASQFRISLPYSDDMFQIQELSSMFVQVKLSQGLWLQYNWKEFRLYLQLEEQWRDNTLGLCGTFNGNIQDDFLAPSGMIESTPFLFGNAWRVSSACVPRPSLPQLDPCDTHQQAASYAVEKCDVLTQEVFSACHEYVSPVGFQLQCRADVCKCGALCLCSILAHYARTCRRHGVIIEFRSHLPECAVSCPSTMEYGVCVSACQRRCLFLSLPQPCGDECEEGCVCPEGTYFNMHTHTCVPRNECPCSFLGADYSPGDVIITSSGVQICQDGKLVSQTSIIETLCPAGQFYEDCGNRVDGPSASKGLACEQTCETYLLNLTCSTHEPCVPGCVCPAGLLKHGDECFKPRACPCLWKGKEYYPGDKVSSPCHQCVCQHGTFQCEFRPCPSMCTAYGDRHYRTFDGFLFDYIGVCKVYLVKSSLDAMLTVTAENVDCFESGVICRKSLHISVGRSFIVFDDDTGRPNPSSVIDRQRAYIWQAGYYTIVHLLGEDLTVLWDRKTTIHIQAGPRWQGRLTGLCGNFDQKTANEMRTPENIDSSTPQEFGNSWTAAECVNSPDIRHPCNLNPLREPFAKRQCGILLSEVFQVCHPVVDVTWFYMNCLVDTCGCNRGGDCECFCTSVAAYAHRCCQKGIPIDWRSPSICPYDCEYYNKALGKGPLKLLTYRERGTLLAANKTSGLVFPKRDLTSVDENLVLFMMTPGISKARPHDSSLVSFEAADRPNYFLKAEQGSQLRLGKWEDTPAFWDAATFVLHRDTWIPGFDSLESLARPGFFLHFMLSRLQLQKYSHSDRYRRATLFKLTGAIPHYPMGPRCQWRFESCVRPCFRTCSDPSGLSCTSILKIEGCLPQCPSHMVLDEVTHRCVSLEDCIRPPVVPPFTLPSTTISSTPFSEDYTSSIPAVSTALISTAVSESSATTTPTTHMPTTEKPTTSPIRPEVVEVITTLTTSSSSWSPLASTERTTKAPSITSSPTSSTTLYTSPVSISAPVSVTSTTSSPTESSTPFTRTTTIPSQPSSSPVLRSTSSSEQTRVSTLPVLPVSTSMGPTEATSPTVKVSSPLTSITETARVSEAITPTEKTTTPTVSSSGISQFPAESISMTKFTSLSTTTPVLEWRTSGTTAEMAPSTSLDTLKTPESTSETQKPSYTTTIPTSPTDTKASTTYITVKSTSSAFATPPATQTTLYTPSTTSEQPETSKTTVSFSTAAPTSLTTVSSQAPAFVPTKTTAKTTYQPTSVIYTYPDGPTTDRALQTDWRVIQTTSTQLELTETSQISVRTAETPLTTYTTMPPTWAPTEETTTLLTSQMSPTDKTTSRVPSTSTTLGYTESSWSLSSTTSLYTEKVSTSPIHPHYTTTVATTPALSEISSASPSILTSSVSQTTSISQTPTITTETAVTSEKPLLTSTAAEEEVVSTTQTSTTTHLTIHLDTETTKASLDTDRAVITTAATAQTPTLVHETSSTIPSTMAPRLTTRITPVLTSRVGVDTIRQTPQDVATTSISPPTRIETTMTTSTTVSTEKETSVSTTIPSTAAASSTLTTPIPEIPEFTSGFTEYTAVSGSTTTLPSFTGTTPTRTGTTTTPVASVLTQTTISTHLPTSSIVTTSSPITSSSTSTEHHLVDESPMVTTLPPTPDTAQTTRSTSVKTSLPYTIETEHWMTSQTQAVPKTTAHEPSRVCTAPYSEVVDECTKLICVSGQLLLFNKSQSCPYDPTPPNCGLLGFAVLVNGDKCCPRWDCPCRCSVFPDLNLITFDGKSVAIYKAALYVVTQLPNETVSILVQECSGPDDTLVWNFTNLCLAALNITHKSNEVLVNRLQRRLYVNSRYAKPRFKKYGFEILDTGNMYLIRSPAGLKIQWFHTTGMMVIEMDSYNNRLPTMGLCGSCDGNPLNDLTLSNGTVVPEQEDPAVFIDSWQIPNTTSYVSNSRRREVNCTTSDCSQCFNMLNNNTFTLCHAYVPPGVFCEMWVRDVEYVNNPCIALAAYAASCHKFNICMEWRSSDFCPFVCPGNLRYQACLPACTAPSCPNQEFEFVPEQCTGLSEGCVCPEGTLLHRPYSALCIPPSKCACTDSFGAPRALGEVWKASLDGCCMYKCENDSIVPVEYNCSNIPQPVCTRTGEITVNLADDSSCCPHKACVCNQSMCEAAPTGCKYGEKMVSYYRQDSCCPEYLCECDPDQCVLDIPVCREDQTLIATRADGSCCLAHICMCDKCPEAVPVCQDGELLIVDTNSTERCCPAYHCLCEASRCLDITCPVGMAVVSARDPEECCPLQTCECACEKLLRPKCSLGQSMQLDRAFLSDPENICACKRFICVREAVCVDGERGVMRPGQTLVEHRDQGVCYATQCTHTLDSATGFYVLRSTGTNCTARCQPNQIYIPPKDPSSCCGTCKNISCLLRNENGSVAMYKPGRSWVSDCLRYDCSDTLAGPVLVTHPYSCPPFNETECMKIGGTIVSYMDGCCKTCAVNSLFPFSVSPLKPTVNTNCEQGKEDGKSCQKVTVRMTIRKNDCRSNRPVNIVSCDGKCPSASIYNYNINTYARFCKCCREMGLQRRSVQLYCSGNSTWVSYTIQEPTDCSCQWS
ncbi:otogelin isoform X2 [Danio rerio]|uniref:Otogelin isoform X2 n=1 Tax=Danio rerio TaxID=7955 RepID=A0AC58G5D1_DANRE